MDDQLEQRIIHLHPLTFLPDAAGVSIGRFGTDTFAVFPEDGAELIKQLQAGLTVGEAARWYEETYQEELDMEDFLEILRDLTFIMAITEGAAPLANDLATPRTDNSTLRGQAFGKWAFSPVAWVLYAALIGAGIAFLWKFPELRPARKHIFFTDYSTLVVVGVFLGQMPGILFHESMHWLAGRRLGLPTKLSVGRRMYMLVFQTSMPGIAGLPRKLRYLPFLAGMFGDVMFFSALVLLAGVALIYTGETNFFVKFCLALSFTTMLRFVWQFYFHLQTDIYYVIVTMLGCVNLQQTTRQIIANFWYRLIRAEHKQHDPSQWAEQDVKAARFYGPVFVFGYTVFLVMLIFIMLPIGFNFMVTVVMNLVHGSIDKMLDSLVFMVINGVQYGTVIWLFVRERFVRHRRQKSIVQGG
ncbi:hypothetical protein [Tumebacillus flagellatus]|uniref:PqqD family protein n=1 Tax=Tumebacillus flagellatus TaxID=1157490 RepID=A0A074LL18_9BACL|nr:hypothetical protein [Tumebacillus flagellatus]KEO81245.1 hypothetical protein EL26_21815 [Tumebacillus flagellatus]